MRKALSIFWRPYGNEWGGTFVITILQLESAALLYYYFTGKRIDLLTSLWPVFLLWTMPALGWLAALRWPQLRQLIR